MPQDPGSPILAALYRRERAEADQLALSAPLTIWEAAALGRDDRVSELLREDPSLANAWAADGFTPLSLAAFFAGVGTVKLLLDAAADVSSAARNDLKVQALHAAVAVRNQPAVTLLLERGSDPNARQQSGYTPLMGAAGAGLDDLVSTLIAAGADPSLVSEDGKTASSIALERGHAELAARLDAAAR